MASPSPMAHVSTFTIDPGPLRDAVGRAHAHLDQLGFADALVQSLDRKSRRVMLMRRRDPELLRRVFASWLEVFSTRVE